MSTTTLLASITWPTDKINTFADAKGYSDVVVDQDTFAESPNPQTREQFVKEWFLEEAVKLLASASELEIKARKNQEMRDELEAAKTEIKSAIVIS